MECLFNPAGCFNSGISSLIAWFPFGLEGIKAAAWMIVGAALGKWGVAAVIALALALKASGNDPERYEHVSGKDAAPAPKKPKTLLGRK